MDDGFPGVQQGKLRTLLKAITEAPTTFDDHEGPSNADKLEYIRETFQCPECDIFSPFPYEEIWQAENPINSKAGMYLCELRITALDHLIEHGGYEDNKRFMAALYQYKLVNLTWRAKMRAKIDLHNIVVFIRNPPDGAAPTVTH